MHNPQNNRLVCFDLGGVIVRICRTWEESCARAGVEVRRDAKFDEQRSIRQAITREFGSGHINVDEWLDRLSASVEGQYSSEEIERIHDAWIIDEYPGWSSFLSELDEANVTTACLSNTNPKHWARMLHIDENDCGPFQDQPEFESVPRLRHHHASHLLGQVKPDEAIYRAFEDTLGVKGSAIVFFDDLEENVNAAAALNWQAFQIDHTRSTVEQVRASLQEIGVL